MPSSPARSLVRFYGSPTGIVLGVAAVALCVLAFFSNVAVVQLVIVIVIALALPHRLARLEQSRVGHRSAIRQIATGQDRTNQRVVLLDDNQKVLTSGAREALQDRVDLRDRADQLTNRLAVQSTELAGLKAAVDELQVLHETTATKLDDRIETLGRSLDSCRSELASVPSWPRALDVVSVLRSMRPVWAGNDTVHTPSDQEETEHGHALMMAALISATASDRAELCGKTLLEIGTTREPHPEQSSTERLAIFTAIFGMKFITVDMDPANTARAKANMRFVNPAGDAITARGEDFLSTYSEPFFAVYMDAFDFDHGHHSNFRRDQYRKYLGEDITDEACWEMHLSCAQLIADRVDLGGVVVFDDTWTDEAGEYDGKGKLAMPFLLSNGFELFASTRNTVAVRKSVEFDPQRPPVDV